MNIKINFNTITHLCEIMARNMSDKSILNANFTSHNYTIFYYELFKYRQCDSLRIFELGLGTNNETIPSNMSKFGRPGASLYGWSEFFQNSKIFGADIDKDILFNTERINTFWCDQTNPGAIENMWNEPLLHDNFDIIIEDGLHEFNANCCFFENSIHKLNVNGYYIIEDINNTDLNRFKFKISEWKLKYKNLGFQLICLPINNGKVDNNLLVVYKMTE